MKYVNFKLNFTGLYALCSSVIGTKCRCALKCLLVLERVKYAARETFVYNISLLRVYEWQDEKDRNRLLNSITKQTQNYFLVTQTKKKRAFN